jgi:hypothetical protein
MIHSQSKLKTILKGVLGVKSDTLKIDFKLYEYYI